MNGSDAVGIRRKVIAATRRVVVKVGSRLLTDIAGTTKQERIAQLMVHIDWMRKQDIEVILVTSGAIGAGMRLLGMAKRPSDLAMLQSLAAVGQCRLMSLYEQASEKYGFHCGQMLLSADDVKDHKRHLNIRNCLSGLLASGVLPIINENDTVSVEEICFGGNDRLAALVGCMTRADLTILLTTVNGLYEREGDVFGERISVVNAISREIQGMAGGTDGNPFSIGGMRTKLDAADICLMSGDSLWIADGTDFGVLRQIMGAEDVGTVFVPSAARMQSTKRYLAFFSDPEGRIVVDDGAATALLKRGKSLLPAGIRAVEGNFEKGDTVTIHTLTGETIGMGVSNYHAADLNRIKGQKTTAIPTVLGRQGYDEAIHRDNLVIREQ